MAAKSGGHSYASYGLGGVEEEALIIELSSFRTVSVADDEDRTAKVGAGMRLGDVAIALNEKGRGLPHGTCPYVGIGGHGSLGGFGFASRMWGLTVDTITAFDAVLANGTVVEKVTAESEPDLFWVSTFDPPTHPSIATYSPPERDRLTARAWQADSSPLRPLPAPPLLMPSSPPSTSRRSQYPPAASSSHTPTSTLLPPL